MKLKFLFFYFILSFSFSGFTQQCLNWTTEKYCTIWKDENTCVKEEERKSCQQKSNDRAQVESVDDLNTYVKNSLNTLNIELNKKENIELLKPQIRFLVRQEILKIKSKILNE